jgi:hypothetical protein
VAADPDLFHSWIPSAHPDSDDGIERILATVLHVLQVMGLSPFPVMVIDGCLLNIC